MSAVDVVAQALSVIGEMISFWLAPGSPPRLLPDIDKWGQAAAEEFLGGFGTADFQTISEFGNTIETLLTSLSIESDTNMILPIVQSLAEGIEEIREFGEVSEATMQNLSANSGMASVEILRLSDQYFELIKAQEELNNITNEYNNELIQLTGTLDDLESTEDIAGRTRRIDALGRALKNQFLTEQQREAIQRSLTKQLQQQKIAEINNRASNAFGAGGAGTSDSESTGQGVSFPGGNQGSPNGSANADNYGEGGGQGEGISYDLGGRSHRSLPKPNYPGQRHAKSLRN